MGYFRSFSDCFACSTLPSRHAFQLPIVIGVLLVFSAVFIVYARPRHRLTDGLALCLTTLAWLAAAVQFVAAVLPALTSLSSPQRDLLALLFLAEFDVPAAVSPPECAHLALVRARAYFVYAGLCLALLGAAMR